MLSVRDTYSAYTQTARQAKRKEQKMKKTALFFVRMLDFRNLGVCPLCMRISFVATILSWLLVFEAMTLNTEVTAVVGIMSIALTFLWLAHISTRAIRSLPPKQVEIDARRVALRAFGRAIVGAAAVSVALLSASKTAESAECGQSCSKTNDNCPSGCICWWELGKCAKLN
jgi:hypothetical protein